jgi:hypothetical protein
VGVSVKSKCIAMCTIATYNLCGEAAALEPPKWSGMPGICSPGYRGRFELLLSLAREAKGGPR